MRSKPLHLTMTGFSDIWICWISLLVTLWNLLQILSKQIKTKTNEVLTGDLIYKTIH